MAWSKEITTATMQIGLGPTDRCRQYRPLIRRNRLRMRDGAMPHREFSNDPYHYRLRTLARWRQGTGARYARSLGAGGSGPALQGSACFVRCDEGTHASGASSVRSDSDL